MTVYYFLGLVGLFLVAAFFALRPWLKSLSIPLLIGFLGLIVASSVAYYSLGTSSLYWYTELHPELVQFYYSLDNTALPLERRKPLADQAAATLNKTALDLPGWLLLSQFYLSINELAPAETSLANAHFIDPNDDKLATEFVQVSFAAQHGAFKPEIQQLLVTLGGKYPENQKVSILLAMMFAQQKKYENALILWRKLEKQLSPDSFEAKLIKNGIKRAENALKNG